MPLTGSRNTNQHFGGWRDRFRTLQSICIFKGRLAPGDWIFSLAGIVYQMPALFAVVWIASRKFI
jgi:hypothetical protein